MYPPHHHPAPRMQHPTCCGIRVRSVHDAHILFHAVFLGLLPMVSRRLDSEERRAVRPGNVYVWEERGRNTEATGLGIERWTDGIRWSASRVRDEFLLYHEREPNTDYEFTDSELGASYRLVKQTYSVFVNSPQGRHKWHLTAYFVPATVTQLRTIDDVPVLAPVHPPEGMYSSAKMGKGRARGEYHPTDIHNGAGTIVPAAHVSVQHASVQQYSSSVHHPPVYAPYNNAYSQPAPIEPREEYNSRSPPSSGWSALPPHHSSTSISTSGRDVRLPHPSRILPSLNVGLRPPAPQGPSPYSPRHPLDDEALRALGRSI